MESSWFSNVGQKIQLAVAALGVILTGINAWPAISNFQLLNIASIIFYIVVLIAAFGIVKATTAPSAVSPRDQEKSNSESPNKLSKLLPEFEQIYNSEVCSQKIVLAKGHDWTSGGDPIFKLRVIYHDLIKEGEDYRADIELHSISEFLGGSLTKSLKEKGSNRFLVPLTRNEHSSARHCMYNFLFTDDTVRFDFVRLAHLNVHSGEAQLFICRGLGHRLNHRKPN